MAQIFTIACNEVTTNSPSKLNLNFINIFCPSMNLALSYWWLAVMEILALCAYNNYLENLRKKKLFAVSVNH